MNCPLCLSLLLLSVPAAVLLAGEPAAAAPEWEVFAPPALCGQVLALTVDDAGRVQAAVSARSFGRGTLTPAAEDTAFLAEDRALLSMEAREAQLQAWQANGRLTPLLKKKEAFFPEIPGKPMDFLTRYTESILSLEDKDHDGKADGAEKIAEGFRSAGEGPGSALLALPEGRWFYGCAPVLWQLQDRNDDLRAEVRNPVASGFGLRLHPEDHGLHALLEAPDGWIYFGTGDRGYVVREASGTSVRGLGSGALFRCRGDGSGLETVATGLQNPTGLAMDASGHLFALDAAGPGKTRLLYVVAGADFGWQAGASAAGGPEAENALTADTASTPDAANAGEPPAERPSWCLPAIATWDGEASSLEALPDGTLLAADRQAGGQGGLFILSLAPQGAGFQLEHRQALWQGGAVMATALGLDGHLYLADWGQTTDSNSSCQIRRWKLPGTAATPESTASLLTQKLPSLAVRELKALLDHPSARVRLRAQQRLSSMNFQDSLEALLQVARRHPSRTARLHGLWGAAAMAQREPALINELLTFLNDPDPAVRAVTATLAGQNPLPDAPPSLRRALTDESLDVRTAAAAAIARLKPPGTLTDLLAAAACNTTHDPAVRSTLSLAMAHGIPDHLLTGSAVPHDSAEARLTAVHALRHLRARSLVKFLTDPDNTIRTEAARAIYDLPVFSAFPDLAALLDVPALAERPLPEALARRALAAAAHFGTAADATRAAHLAAAPGLSPALRLEALALLETWDTPADRDPLWNRPAFPIPRLPGLARSALREAAEALQNDEDAAVAGRAKTLARLPSLVRQTAAAHLAVVQDANRPEPDRLAAIQSLVTRLELSADMAKALVLPVLPAPVRAEARSWLMRHDPKSAPGWVNDAFLTGTVLEKQAALKTLNRLPGNGNDNEKLLLEFSRRLGQGTVETGVQVEVLEALQRRDIQSRSPWRRATDSWIASLPMNTDPLAGWRMTMAEGDPAAGRLLFESQTETDCTSCHSIRGVGGSRGPDLDGVADRLTASGILQSLIHPGARLAKGYETIPEATTPALPTPPPRPEEAEAPALPAPDLTADPVSPMPPAGTLLTLRELRDLISYLRTLKRPAP